MKTRISLVAVAMFVATLACTSVRAQSAGQMAVSIPFEFVAGGKTLPAGDYYVRRSFDGARSILRIESQSTSQSIYLATHAVTSSNSQETRLVFNKYGQQHFLSQVWMAGRSAGAEVNKSSRERGLLQELAQLKSKNETVSVALRSN